MNLEKAAKVPVQMTSNLRLTGFLSSRKSYQSNRALPPLMRQGTGRQIRWDGRAPLGNVTKNIQAQRDGSLSEFIAAKQHPTNLRSQFPPTLATNEADTFHQKPVTTDPAASDNFRDGFAPKTSSEKTAADPRLALQKGMNEARRLMYKHMAPTDRASYLLRQYYERMAKAGNEATSKL